MVVQKWTKWDTGSKNDKKKDFPSFETIKTSLVHCVHNINNNNNTLQINPRHSNLNDSVSYTVSFEDQDYTNGQRQR